MSAARGNPFSPRAALGLVLFGAFSFIALLWAIGSGMADPKPGAKGSHVNGKGLDGYAAFAGFLEQRGYTVRRVQSRGALRQGGLLILTPTHRTTAEELAGVIDERRNQGPTILIMPKWIAGPLPENTPSAKARKGFVQLVEAIAPNWRGFHDEVGVRVDKSAVDSTWQGLGASGQLPDPARVLWGGGGRLVPLIETGSNNMTLAGYFSDGGDYPALRNVAIEPEPAPDEEPADAASLPSEEAPADGYGADPAPPMVPVPIETASGAPQYDAMKYADAYPVIVVFEPDLLNNYGMAQQAKGKMQKAKGAVKGAMGNDV